MVSSLIWPLLASIVSARVVDLTTKESTSPSLDVRPGTVTGSASATWNQNIELLTDIQIADKTFKVVLDTGSADMWLFCTSGSDSMETGRDAYNPVTGTRVNGSDGKAASFNIKYGKGFAEGSVYTDKVTLGGLTVDQAIGCATSVSQDDINDRNMDGLIGMAFNSGGENLPTGLSQTSTATKSALNSDGDSVTTQGGGFLGLFKSDKPNAQNTFMENAYSELKAGLFTVDIRQKQDGAYNFGYVDSTRFSTPLTYMPVQNWHHWVVQSSGYSIGATATTQVNKVLIDTGTTNIMVTTDIAKKYFAMVPKAAAMDSSNWNVPCDAGTMMPDLTFTFTPPPATGATSFPEGSGGSSQMVYNAIVPGSLLIGNLSGKNDGMCQATLSASDKNDSWDLILGDAFLKGQLVVFDMAGVNGYTGQEYPERGQIGFSQKPEFAEELTN